jgi:hypothetical protein
MANTGSKIGMKVLTVAVSIPIGIAVRKTVEKVWTATPAGRKGAGRTGGERWADALGWAALSGAGMAIADLVARKGAEELWHTVGGSKPPVQARPTASKRVRKARQRRARERDAEPNNLAAT